MLRVIDLECQRAQGLGPLDDRLAHHQAGQHGEDPHHGPDLEALGVPVRQVQDVDPQIRQIGQDVRHPTAQHTGEPLIIPAGLSSETVLLQRPDGGSEKVELSMEHSTFVKGTERAGAVADGTSGARCRRASAPAAFQPSAFRSLKRCWRSGPCCAPWAAR